MGRLIFDTKNKADFDKKFSIETIKEIQGEVKEAKDNYEDSDVHAVDKFLSFCSIWASVKASIVQNIASKFIGGISVDLEEQYEFYTELYVAMLETDADAVKLIQTQEFIEVYDNDDEDKIYASFWEPKGLPSIEAMRYDNGWSEQV